ncbi:hypothetical protein HBI56_005140 [Parastagonospora nodorum]|nr:hypothetical protein HBH53_079290 [Parastagonospora nodorum]KAH4005552.1 hypothetical protein HBI10_033540 [Parastagonospora nodorum]KAH4033053.1 hypothetical protein HBI13_005560 [Parastagonospora nodorum]KAH4041860.1 hypothetical protein HBI09_005470 [Parastagonospora nodorum]KAH4124198.1 hypothetical protein HBH47_071700 [Parastagonospora nodorum]
MSSNSYYGQATKAAYTSRPSTSSTTYSSASSSIYAQSADSSRAKRYGSKPPVIHNGGGQTHDPNTSSSAPSGSYHS